jgi:hypothetical protein
MDLPLPYIVDSTAVTAVGRPDGEQAIDEYPQVVDGGFDAVSVLREQQALEERAPQPE